MPAWYPLLALPFAVGLSLMFSEMRWFRTPPIVERLRPYAPPGTGEQHRRGWLNAASLRDVIGPLVTTFGNRVSTLLGVNDDLSVRLQRAEVHLEVTEFRLKQATYALASMVAAAGIGAMASMGPSFAIAATVCAPVLTFLILEQRVTTASQRWQEAITLELPVVIEQLGMLLSAGYSIGAAINRLGRRGRGRSAAELAKVSARIRQGIPEIDALREWAAYTDLAAVERLVGVLALNWEASDLGALISAEARSVRREVQRQQVELIERRSQQVWVPVTVATLVPGVIFMAVPFIDAMGKLTGR